MVNVRHESQAGGHIAGDGPTPQMELRLGADYWLGCIPEGTRLLQLRNLIQLLLGLALALDLQISLYFTKRQVCRLGNHHKGAMLLEAVKQEPTALLGNAQGDLVAAAFGLTDWARRLASPILPETTKAVGQGVSIH